MSDFNHALHWIIRWKRAARTVEELTDITRRRLGYQPRRAA